MKKNNINPRTVLSIKNRTKTRRSFYFGLIVSSFLFLSSCSSSEEKEIPAPGKSVAVTVAEAGTSQETSFVTASGKLTAKNSVNVSTRIMGYITSLRAQIGQNVQTGQVLVSINATDIQAKGGQVSAQIAQAEANFNSAKRDYERFQNLFNSESASQKELDDMRTRYEMAKAGLQAAREMKREVNSQYSYTSIAAPISGTVTAKYVEQGDLASPGMPLLTIESASQLQAEVLVSENSIPMINEGMQVDIQVKSLNKTVRGKVSEISRSSTSTGGQYLVKIQIPKETELLPGMFVYAQFPLKEISTANQAFQQSISIPKSALVEKGQLQGVYVVSAEGTALLRWLQLGRTTGDNVEVLSGLKSGEKYITTSSGRLYNGIKIQVR